MHESEEDALEHPHKKHIFTFLLSTLVLWMPNGMLNQDPHIGLKNIFSKFIPRIYSMIF
jgi:hypothetical protein